MADNYPLSHIRNASCKFQGTIEFTIMTDELKRLNLKKRNKKGGSPHSERNSYYVVEYPLVIGVCGRIIRYQLWLDSKRKVSGILNAE